MYQEQFTYREAQWARQVVALAQRGDAEFARKCYRDQIARALEGAFPSWRTPQLLPEPRPVVTAGDFFGWLMGSLWVAVPALILSQVAFGGLGEPGSDERIFVAFCIAALDLVIVFIYWAVQWARCSDPSEIEYYRNAMHMRDEYLARRSECERRLHTVLNDAIARNNAEAAAKAAYNAEVRKQREAEVAQERKRREEEAERLRRERFADEQITAKRAAGLLGPRDAEHWIAGIIRRVFHDPGAQVTQATRDGGADIVSEHVVVEVKRHQTPAPPVAVRALAGVSMVPPRIPVFFSCGGYSAEAERFAEAAGVLLFTFDWDLTTITPVNKLARQALDRGTFTASAPGAVR